MSLRLRTLLLASAAPAWAVAAPAAAVDVTDARTTAIATSTANNGAADNIKIISTGGVTVTSGAAVTLDSNNTVENIGTISITDADGATGVRVLGGFTGTVDNTGVIVISEDVTRTDDDGDGTIDGPFAQGTGRTGILIEGPAPFTGNVSNGGSITVEGNNSRGIDVQTDLDGSVIQRGAINLFGDQGAGIQVRGDVTEDVRLGGNVSVSGQNSAGAILGGDIGGGLSNGATIQTSGFQYPTATNYFDPDSVSADYVPAPLDDDDLKDNAPALVIAGDIAEGFLNNGTVGGGASDDDSDGNDPVKDIPGDFDINRQTGVLTSLGSAPAVLISPDYATSGSGDVVIGLVVERVRDTADDDDDGDLNEEIGTFLEAHGFINRGIIGGEGINVGFAANGVVILGSQDGTRNTIIQGGILNNGDISARSLEANATALRLGAGAQTPRLDNTGTIRASTFTETDHTVTVLLIESGALLSAINNSGQIAGASRGDQGNVFAIRDLSGSLLTIENTGSITAVFEPDQDDDDGDGRLDDGDEITGQSVAIDLSGHGAGQNVTITQTLPAPSSDVDEDGDIDIDDAISPVIRGGVRLGAGDDDVQLLAGEMTGDLSFGAGADNFAIDGGAEYRGTLSDADGQLVVNVDEGKMMLSQNTNVTVTTLTLGDQSVSTFAIDMRPATAANARIVADVINIGAGAELIPEFVGLGSTAATTVEILRAEGSLALTGGQAITDNLSIDTPFLYDASIGTQSDGSAESVVVTVRRRSPDELGMSANHAAAYEPVVAALNTDAELLAEIVSVETSEEFYTAYNQLLPEFSLSAMQFAVSNVDGSIGAVGTRLDAVRGGREGSGAVWLQEFGLYVDRESSFSDPGYRGNGFGMALGVDRPLGPFYAVGVNVVGAASEIEQPGGFDTPMSVASAHIGTYAAANIGNLLFDLYAGAGADFFESERQILVGAVTRRTSGDWHAQHTTASARIAYDMNMRRLFARPAVSVDYFQLNEEGYSEFGGGTGVDLLLEDRTSEMLSTTASLTLGARFGDVNRTWWSPRVRVGLRHESMGDPQLTTARYLAGGDPFELRADDLPDSGGLVGFTFAAGSRWSSFALDYDADIREGFVRHGVRVAFRFIF